MIKKDFIIVGSGIAGLSAAFFASQKGSVALITKGSDLKDSKSFNNNDGVLFSKNLDILKKDILESQKISDEDFYKDSIIGKDRKNKTKQKHKNEKIDFFIENVNGVFYFLRDVLGIKFSLKGEKIFGFSEENIFFSGEKTGREICKKFISKIESGIFSKNIEIFLDTEVTELISEKIKEREARIEFVGGKRVSGVIGKNLKTGVEQKFFGNNVLIATGTGDGIHDFNYISDGIKLAKSVGAKIGKMNFISWNPLCLDLPSLQKFFLPLEILNNGAFLINEKGEKFVDKYLHGNKNFLLSDLSDSFFLESKKTGKIFLDMRHKSKHFWEENFPELYNFLKLQGVDIMYDVMLLKNIQQFLVGGIEVSDNSKTSVQGLYVSGELANFGILGKNWLPGVLISKSIILSKSFVDGAVL